MRRDLTPGKLFPDLELPDHGGHGRTLSELAGGDPVLLQFFRGWFCPKERAFFASLLQLQSEAEVAYTRFVSVSVETTETQAAFRAGLGARWTFLSDHERRYIDELELRETSDTLYNPYLPTVFTLYPDLKIQAAYNGYWFWCRRRVKTDPQTALEN
ncbi:hypothetical protein BH18ACT17_BH18ACT17_16970 [soil metagenome]